MESRFGIDSQTMAHSWAPTDKSQADKSQADKSQSDSTKADSTKADSTKADSGVHVAMELPIATVIEFKGMPITVAQVSPLWLLWSRANWRVRALQLLPLGCLLAVGTLVPGFLMTLGVLLLAIMVSLGAFVLLVQLPIG